MSKKPLEKSPLPPPKQLLLVPLNEMELAELIEKHINYYKENDQGNRRSVHLPMTFVRHYLQRYDSVMPTATAISTLPIVLGDGELLAPKGEYLDRTRGIIFDIPSQLQKVLPKREDCTTAAVAAAMRFLFDEWLVDVTTDFHGKCIIVAAALTLIERSLLDNRPVFFVSAGRRGGGKTTLIIMLIRGVTGFLPAASTWSMDEEERRKVLLSQFLHSVPYILWDNIRRGMQLDCPHVERSCTSAFYADRKLGVSEMVRTSAATIHFFTGNNIAPKGDLASRALHIRINVDRPDPENREFVHSDPVGWTDDHRGQILAALFTVLLGNPRLDQPRDAAGKTRFKLWWRLIGSAVEHGARCAGLGEIDFEELFLNQEQDDEDTNTLVDVFNTMLELWPNDSDGSPTVFLARDVADHINGFSLTSRGTVLREFLFPAAPFGFSTTPKSVGRRLMQHLDEPVQDGERTLALRLWRRHGRDLLAYYVEQS